VTDVLRGDDLLPSTARQWYLQRALGISAPRWWHVPLVYDESCRRLAKRSHDLSLSQLREHGTDPRAIVAWVAQCSGMNVPERVTASDALAQFDLARVPRAKVLLSHEQLQTLHDAR
jgi:glutamyl-tRNA synthetase